MLIDNDGRVLRNSLFKIVFEENDLFQSDVSLIYKYSSYIYK